MTEFIQAVETWPQAIVAAALVIGIACAVVVLIWTFFR